MNFLMKFPYMEIPKKEMLMASDHVTVGKKYSNTQKIREKMSKKGNFDGSCDLPKKEILSKKRSF